MGIFFGTHERKLRKKNKVLLPADFHKEFGAGAVVVFAIKDGCLNLYRKNAKNKYAGLHWEELPINKDGMITLSESMKEFIFPLGVNKVVLVGVNDHVEAWDQIEWTREIKTIELHFQQLKRVDP